MPEYKFVVRIAGEGEPLDRLKRELESSGIKYELLGSRTSEAFLHQYVMTDKPVEVGTRFRNAGVSYAARIKKKG